MGTGKDIEELVTDAMGNSVTPSRLQQSKKPGILRRLLGNETVEGPFIEDIGPDEQPHYLFHTTNKIELPEDNAEDGALLSLFGRSSFSPGTLLITDEQVLLIYNSGMNRVVRGYHYTAIEDVEYQRIPRIERGLELMVDGDRLSFEMWDTENFGEELSDAATYISEKSDVTYTNATYDFEDGQFDDVADVLRTQLQNLDTTARNLDTSFVLGYAKTGAEIGIRRDPRTAAFGFFLGAGYGIWADIHQGEDDEPPTVDSENIDAQTTAKEIVRWKQVGERVGDRKGGLAGAAVGAAVALDQQTTGRKSTRVLSELDLDAVDRRLEDGNFKEGGLEIASQALDSYTDGLEILLADDFFEQLQ